MKRDALKTAYSNEGYGEIIVLGEIAKDHIFYINNQKEELLWDIKFSDNFFGGMGANVSAGYRLLGTYPYFVTVCTEELLHNFENVGIKIVQLPIHVRLSEIYNYFFPKTERRTIAIQRGSILTENIDFELDLGLNNKMDNVNIVHVCPINVKLAIKIPLLYKKALKVLSPAIEYPKNTLNKIISGYDVIIFDEQEALAYTSKSNLEDAINEFISTQQSKCIVITRGSLGSVGVYKHKVYYQSVIQLEYPVIDTMGCGDIFSASFSYYFLKTKGNVRKALKTATLYSGYFTSVKGMWLELFDNMDTHIDNLKKLVENNEKE